MCVCKLDIFIKLDNDPIQFTFWSRNRVIDRLRLLMDIVKYARNPNLQTSVLFTIPRKVNNGISKALGLIIHLHLFLWILLYYIPNHVGIHIYIII
jgi:hypothetical protein